MIPTDANELINQLENILYEEIDEESMECFNRVVKKMRKYIKKSLKEREEDNDY